MSKPTIYGFCPAGCKYPVASKDEFDNVASQVNEMMTGKVGDIIIPHKELLWSGNAAAPETIILNSNIATGDKLRVVGYIGTKAFEVDFLVNQVGYTTDYKTSAATTLNSITLVYSSTTSSLVFSMFVYSANEVRVYAGTDLVKGETSATTVNATKIYKVIE